MKKSILFFVLLFFSANIAYSQNDSILKSVEKYLLQVKEEWKIPGISMSIIKDGEIIMAKGFGVRELGRQIPVDESTICHIGSISKSFTAAVMASLVDEGLVSWEDTVKNILPDFEWYDKWVEDNMQVKDLMTHKTGLLGQQGTYLPNVGYNRDDIYKMFSLLKPAHSFRGVYDYNNMTFLIAEKIIEKKTGKSWEENIQERIFQPLGMTSSYLNGEGYLEAGDKASIAHEFNYVKDSMQVVPLYGDERALHWLTVIGPAGGISSNVVDMAKYIQFHLDMGKVGDRQLISEKSMKFLHRGQTIVAQNDSMIRLYGHCWFVEQNNRYRLYFHTGTTWGFTAICAFVPQLNLGMAILVNSEAPSSPRYAIMRKTIDLFMGDSVDIDYNAEYLEQWWKGARIDYIETEVEKESEVILPALDNSLFTGCYTKDELFSDAVVTEEGGKLFIAVGKQGWKRELKHVNGLEYNFRSDGKGFPVTFELNKKGTKAVSLSIDFLEDEDFSPWTRK